MFKRNGFVQTSPKKHDPNLILQSPLRCEWHNILYTILYYYYYYTLCLTHTEKWVLKKDVLGLFGAIYEACHFPAHSPKGKCSEAG